MFAESRSVLYIEYIQEVNGKMRIIKLKSGRKIKVVEVSEHGKYISKNDEEMDARAVEAVRAAVSKAKFCQKPIARYDTQTKKVYVEYADGDDVVAETKLVDGKQYV